MKYPIGIQNFQKIREEGYVYVDKTASIYKLASSGCYYFLSRPRRFGKSLLLSTMKSYFTGKKELFEGLALAELETEWASYPVLYLDLNSGKYESGQNLYAVLDDTLRDWENQYGAGHSTEIQLRFKHVIRNAYEKTGRQVVILVDEYDKPLLQALGNEELQEEFRSTLKAFYSVLKTQDQYIRFAFLTGVTKFSKLSVFSDLNNLNDISMDKQYTDICGITEKEMHAYFEESIRELSVAVGMSYEDTLAKLEKQYDGYHFSEDSPGMYNPFSLLNTFNKRRFKDYWYETGTPTFLIRLLKQTNYDLRNLDEIRLSSRILGSMDSVMKNPIPTLYQSGYLTIKGYDEESERYLLGFPNDEVEKGFIMDMLPQYVSVDEQESEFFIDKFVADVKSGNPDMFMQRLQTFLADSSYMVAGDKEIYFQNVISLIFRFMGFYTQVERTTSSGRMDIVIQTKDYIYVMELKLDGTADEALQQIEEKGYAAPFALDSRKLYKIGVNFSGETRGIESWKIAQ